MRLRPFTLLTLAFFAASFVPAQPPPDGAADQQAGEDPPSRAARLSFLSGTVSFQPGGVEDWVPAALNRPLTTGDRLWTEAGSRAELNLGTAALRLNGRTNFTFLNLDDGITQVQLSTGTLSVRLRRLDEGETFEIDTPQIAFSLQRPGEYRIDVNEQGDVTLVTVRAGQGEALAGDQTQPIYARQQVRASGTGDAPVVFDERDSPVADAFDNFCMDRDRREDRSESARHVSRDMPGYADLDANGVWREDQQYGWIWAPRVDPDWAPYHNGHWVWIAPWGWTWVDDAPWGYAPFHYGRWANAGGVWVWVPGPPAVRPVYAPALVAWVGGPRFGVSLAIGGGAAVGWFALGPGEIWAPAYRASPRYFSQVNVTNTVVSRNVNITNVYNNVYVNRSNTNFVYANRNVNGAVSALPQNAMVTGRPVAQAGIRVPPGALGGAEIQRGASVAPERAAVFGGAVRPSSAPPAGLANRRVVARATPPPAPVPFAQQQTTLQQNPGQPLNRATLNQMQRGGQERPQYRQVQVRQGAPAQNATPPVTFDRSNRPPNVQTPPPSSSQPVPFNRPERPATVSPAQNPDALPRRVEQPNRPAPVERSTPVTPRGEQPAPPREQRRERPQSKDQKHEKKSEDKK
jgi:hypothetical protein